MRKRILPPIQIMQAVNFLRSQPTVREVMIGQDFTHETHAQKLGSFKILKVFPDSCKAAFFSQAGYWTVFVYFRDGAEWKEPFRALLEQNKPKPKVVVPPKAKPARAPRKVKAEPTTLATLVAPPAKPKPTDDTAPRIIRRRAQDSGVQS